MLSTTRIFPKTPRLKNHRPKFSGIFIHTDPSSQPIRWFHREMRASDSRCVETNARGERGERVAGGPSEFSLVTKLCLVMPFPEAPLRVKSGLRTRANRQVCEAELRGNAFPSRAWEGGKRTPVPPGATGGSFGPPVRLQLEPRTDTA